MKPSKYKQEQIRKLKVRAVDLYRQGLGLRTIAKQLGRSHEWVRQAVKELDTT